MVSKPRTQAGTPQLDLAVPVLLLIRVEEFPEGGQGQTHLTDELTGDWVAFTVNSFPGSIIDE